MRARLDGALSLTINADLAPVPAAVPPALKPTPVPEPLEPRLMPPPGHIVAAFAPLPTLLAGQHLTREHAVCLDAYRHACGMSAWLEQPPGTDVTVTASTVNQAVRWWNSWHKPKAAS